MTPDGLTDAEALFRRGPSAVEFAECTPQEFRDWYLAIPPARQVEVAEHLLQSSRSAATCFITNHQARIEDAEVELRRLRLLEEQVLADQAVVILGDDGYRAVMTDTNAPEPTTDVPVETPAKNESTVEVAAEPELAGDSGQQPADGTADVTVTPDGTADATSTPHQ